jgi:hypothetical protein
MSTATQTFDVGDVARAAVVFAPVATGTPTDPTAVTCRVMAPSGTVTTYTYGTDTALVKDSTGTYHLDITLTEPYTWHVRWQGTGAVATAEEQTFYVRQSAFS